MKIVGLICSAALALPALAAPDDGVWAFARANAGKFETEIQAPAQPMRVTITADVRTEVHIRMSYDPRRAVMTLRGLADLNRVWLPDRCARTGSYVGKTALGVSRKVEVRTCQRLELVDPQAEATVHHTDEGLVEVPMDPNQYRSIKDRGILFEVEFMPGPGAEAEVVEASTWRGQPKVDWPYESTYHDLVMRGSILSVTAFTRDRKLKLAEQRRPAS